jgi:hypothetical protein
MIPVASQQQRTRIKTATARPLGTGRKKMNSWQRLKSDPLKMKAYRQWRKEYLLKKKKRTLDSLFPVIRKNVVYKRVEELFAADFSDEEILKLWKIIKALLESRGSKR